MTIILRQLDNEIVAQRTVAIKSESYTRLSSTNRGG